MLGQFTWGQFLGCYGAVSLLWYLGLLFTAYRKEALGLLGIGTGGERREGVLKFKSPNDAVADNRPGLNQVRKEQTAMQHLGASVKDKVGNGVERERPGNYLAKNNNDSKDRDQPGDDELMGKVRPPEGLERIETGSLAFAPAGKEKHEAEGEIAEEVSGGGLYGDLVTGIREIYGILAANDGNKQDFFGMVSQLKVQFGPVGSSPCVPRVNAYIRDSAPFAISDDELENLWD